MVLRLEVKNMSETIYPMEKSWDSLLVLDACRYDCFEKLHEEYFKGELMKVISPGSETSEWCRAVFKEKYEDVVYVSSNPRINSEVEVRGFKASEHFHEVIDVWDWGWDENLGTVKPETVNEAALEAEEKYPEKRLIVHYMQPHAPYLTLKDTRYKMSKSPYLQKIDSKDKGLRSFLGPKLRGIVGPRATRKLREFLGLSPLGPLHATLREVGEEGLRQAYEENVKAVFEEARNLVDELPGEIVITADHGELLGEDGFFGHPRKKRFPTLMEVPWLEVES